MSIQQTLSMYLMALLAGLPLGALIGGALGDIVGLRATVVGAALALALFTLYVFLAFQAMGSFDELPEGAGPVRPRPLTISVQTLTTIDYP
jgi:hypothetical protein